MMDMEVIWVRRQAKFLKFGNLLEGCRWRGTAGDGMLPSGPDHRPASDATHSISISIAGFGSALTTQVVRAG